MIKKNWEQENTETNHVIEVCDIAFLKEKPLKLLNVLSLDYL